MDVILLKEGKFEQLYKCFSPALRARIPFEDVRKALKMFQMNMKTIETRHLADRTQWRDYFGRYIVDLWQDDEQIIDFRMTEVVNQTTKQRYIFPFEGTWVTLYADEQYIFKKTSADPSLQIVAPAKGVVESVSANGMIIRHSENEYSYLTGFTPRVLVGKKVARGTFLGTIGSSETLHFQVLRTPATIVQQALSISFKRVNKIVKGDLVANGRYTKTEKMERLSDGASLIELLADIGDIILWIPRAIFHALK